MIHLCTEHSDPPIVKGLWLDRLGGHSGLGSMGRGGGEDNRGGVWIVWKVLKGLVRKIEE